jgi:hypothetical protein
LPGGEPAGGARLPNGEDRVGNRLPLAVNDQGAVFFNSTVQLVAADDNGVSDVYRFQAGETTLISPGTGNFAAFFGDASESGDDVFFTTTQGLVSRDLDGELDVYDSRLGGGLPSQSPVSVPACRKSTCSPAGGGPAGGLPVLGSQQSGPGEPGGAAAKLKVRLGRVSFTARAMRIRFTASRAGRVRVSGRRVATTVRRVSKAGTYSLVVPLNKKARQLRRANRRLRVAVKVTFSGGRRSSTLKFHRTLGK